MLGVERVGDRRSRGMLEAEFSVECHVRTQQARCRSIQRSRFGSLGVGRFSSPVRTGSPLRPNRAALRAAQGFAPTLPAPGIPTHLHGK